MDTTEQNFLDALRANDDETLWQVYADWLEERGDVRADYLRLVVGLAQGFADGQRATQTAAQLWALRPQITATWLNQVAQLRALRPPRFRIDDVFKVGNFSRLVVTTGFLEVGTLRCGDWMAIPVGAQVVRNRVRAFEHFSSRSGELRQIIAHNEPTNVAIGWAEERSIPNARDVPRLGCIVPWEDTPTQTFANVRPETLEPS